ncbi:DMT family transporter [Streptomyces sp. LHD-70]|uniref:DMT family transporter n=1 Tax=Streptomyces sp. LHD-70 TaxID=3072140 RepID=UPI00280D9F33|nr:DMT family transporter [Streptomyces sp. LHD-70]MDQ8707641.1 DMT family transporter [Streptomyces sp. LHD-70]
MHVLWLLLAVFSGALISLQARINGQLAADLGDGTAAAVLSFGSGLLVLSVGLLAVRGARHGLGRVVQDVRQQRLKWWQLLGGCGGATFVLAQGLTVGALGVALFTVAVVAGQVGGGLLVDAKGLGPAGPQRPTVRRAVGAGLVLVAVGVSMADRLGAGFPYLLLVLPVVAGVCVSWQQAVNGHVRLSSGSAYTGTYFNFLTGTAVLGLVFVGHAVLAGVPAGLPGDPYLYLGGLVGIAFISVAVAAVQKLGVLLLGLCTITGQLLGSLALDVFLPHGDAQVSAFTVGGAALALAAVALAAVSGSSRGGRSRIRAAGRVVSPAARRSAADADASSSRSST